jgi:hypothetical protein
MTQAPFLRFRDPIYTRKLFIVSATDKFLTVVGILKCTHQDLPGWTMPLKTAHHETGHKFLFKHVIELCGSSFYLLIRNYI